MNTKWILLFVLSFIGALRGAYAANPPTLNAQVKRFDFAYDLAFVTLCKQQNMPCGVEETVCNDLHSQTEKNKPRTLKETTVGKILAEIVRRHPGYRWMSRDDVLNLESTKRVAPDFLSTPLDKVSLNEIPSDRATDMIFRQANFPQPAGYGRTGPPQVFANVNIQLSNTTVRDALNAIAKADGKAIWRYCPKDINGWIPELQMITWRTQDEPQTSGGH